MREIRPKYLSSSAPATRVKREPARPADLDRYVQGVRQILASDQQTGLQRILTNYIQRNTRAQEQKLALPAAAHKNRQAHILIGELSQAGPALVSQLLAAHHVLTRFFPEKDQPKAAGSLRSIVSRTIIKIARCGQETAVLAELTEDLLIKTFNQPGNQENELAREILIYETDAFRHATWTYWLGLTGPDQTNLPPARKLPETVRVILETSLVRSLGRAENLAEFTDLLYDRPEAVEELSESMLKVLVGYWQEFHLAEEPRLLIERFGQRPWQTFCPEAQRAILLDVMRTSSWIRQVRQARPPIARAAAGLRALSPILDCQPWLRPLLHGYLLVHFYDSSRDQRRAEKLAKLDQPETVAAGLIMKICHGSIKNTLGLLHYLQKEEPELWEKLLKLVQAGDIPRLYLYLNELVANAIALATHPIKPNRLTLVRSFSSPKVLSDAVKVTEL